MKFFLMAKLFFLNSYLYSEKLKYKNISDNLESTDYSILKHPKYSGKILDIKKVSVSSIINIFKYYK